MYQSIATQMPTQEIVMTTPTRRDVVVSAAAAAAVFGLDKPLTFIGSASAQESATKGFHSFKVGDIKVTTLYDGVNVKPHDAGFIKNASVDDTKAALKAAGLADDAVRIPFTITVVEMGGKTIMFDSGTGAQLAPTAGLLAANMKAAGIDPAKIDTILITHFHPDHIFGLMAKETNAQTYPNAQIIIPAAEFAFWGDQGVFAKLPEGAHGLAKRIQATLPAWPNVTRFEGDKDVVAGIRSVAAYGHTPGHTVFMLGSGKDQLMVLADTANIPALFVKNPGWHIQFDGDPVKAEATRRKLFDQAVADGAIITGYHFGMPGAGRIMKDGNGYAFVPVA
jgi:glyoxylase-like metal-dependent hydrolase (beta-lactamase superfamily II)